MPFEETLSVWPFAAVPEIVGAAVANGAAGSTTALTGESALAGPAVFVAVTVTRSVEPASASPTA